MEIFANLLRGSYAYLLIGQILLVSGLMLAFLWLVVRRTQEATNVGVGTDFPDTASAAAPIVTGIPEAQHAELQKRLDALQSEYETLKSSSADATALREKVRYLESRLLEYEILQEEIGTLSQLKLENEHLKEEIVLMQTDSRGTPIVAPPPAPAPVVAAPAPASLPEPPAPTMGSYSESVLSPKVPAAPPRAPVPGPDLVKAVLVTPNHGLIPPSSPEGGKQSLAAGESAASGLESLLDQIDKLTATPNE